MQSSDYLPLTCPCPAVGNGCLRINTAGQNELIEWHRSSCGHRTHINSEALIKCVHPSCNETGKSIISHKFDCGKHKHEERFLGVNAMNLVHASSVMLAASNHYTDKVWVQRLAQAFMKEMMKIPVG